MNAVFIFLRNYCNNAMISLRHWHQTIFSGEFIGVKQKVRNIWPKNNIKFNRKPIIHGVLFCFMDIRESYIFFFINWLVKNLFWISTQLGMAISLRISSFISYELWATFLSKNNLWKYWWIQFHDNFRLTAISWQFIPDHKKGPLRKKWPFLSKLPYHLSTSEIKNPCVWSF